MPPIEFIVRASTPEDLRQELLEYLRLKHLDAAARARVRNLSARTRFSWQVRAEVIEEAALFIRGLKILPKPLDTSSPKVELSI